MWVRWHRTFYSLLALWGMLLTLGVASSASASTVVTGNSEAGTKDRFEAPGLTVDCVGHFAGTAATTSEASIKLHPTYSECESSLGAATVDTSGCDYVVEATTNWTGHLPVKLECSGTNLIKVTMSGCTLSFASQTTAGGVKATNLGSGGTREITADLTVATATFSKSGSLCFAISGDTGSYTAITVFKGYRDEGGPTGEDKYTEGAQKGIWWEGSSFHGEEE